MGLAGFQFVGGDYDDPLGDHFPPFDHLGVYTTHGRTLNRTYGRGARILKVST